MMTHHMTGLSPVKLDIMLLLKEVNRQQASSGGGQSSELFQTQQTFLHELPAL